MLTRSERKLLAEIGLLAAGNHMTKEAALIFDALESIDADQEVIAIGRGYLLMNSNHYAEAAKVLYDYCNGKPAGLSDFLLGLSLGRIGFGSQVDQVILKLESSPSENMRILGQELKEVVQNDSYAYQS